MKNLLISLATLVLFAIHIQAQNPIKYEKVIQMDSSLNKEILYNRGVHWITSIFRNPQKVIQLNDKEKGQIVCKGNFEYNQKKFIWGGSDQSKGQINFMLKLYFKDGRYKYIFTDFIHETRSKSNSFGLITDEYEYYGKMSLTTRKWRQLIWDDIKDQIEDYVYTIRVSLVKEMKIKNDTEDDNW